MLCSDVCLLMRLALFWLEMASFRVEDSILEAVAGFLPVSMTPSVGK